MQTEMSIYPSQEKVAILPPVPEKIKSTTYLPDSVSVI